MAKGQKTGGRKKGTPNKKSAYIEEQLANLDCDPIEGMARIAANAEKEKNPQLAGAMYKELASYLYPKKKAVDISHQDTGPTVFNIITGVDRD